MEEIATSGVALVFLNHAIGSTPEEALLLQMQGVIAEYERAKIMERNRRGKRHAANRGSVNAVPALISEELFLAVQAQLDENRQRARQRRGGASYLLQGLTVCAHCHYAYYGRGVGYGAANGRQLPSYYRCRGTDAHCFGGVRVCDTRRCEPIDWMTWYGSKWSIY